MKQIAGTVITSPVAQELAVTISNHLASINLHLENLTSDLGYLVFNNLENRGGRSLNLDMLRRQPYDTNTATLVSTYAIYAYPHTLASLYFNTLVIDGPVQNSRYPSYNTILRLGRVAAQ